MLSRGKGSLGAISLAFLKSYLGDSEPSAVQHFFFKCLCSGEGGGPPSLSIGYIWRIGLKQ